MPIRLPIRRILTAQIQRGSPDPNLPAYLPVANTTEWQDWHVYKFVWTPDTMEWWIDGLIRMSCANFILPGYKMFFMISPEISGIWPGDPDGTTTWPMTAEVDYVRIYEGAPENPPPAAPDFTDDWTGTNGAAWNAAKWPVIGVTSTSVVDIQGNQGRFLPQGAAFARCRAESASGNFADFDLTLKFTLGTVGAEQYHSINVRHTGSWSGNNAVNAYRFMISEWTFSFTPIVAGATGTSVNVAKTWNTSQYSLRIVCVGTSLRARVWQGTEPGTWDIDQTNASHTTGIISLISLCGSGAAGTPRPIQYDDLLVTST